MRTDSPNDLVNSAQLGHELACFFPRSKPAGFYKTRISQSRSVQIAVFRAVDFAS
jgi:hypothetical protein